jgi:hypothetical protein
MVRTGRAPHPIRLTAKLKLFPHRQDGLTVCEGKVGFDGTFLHVDLPNLKAGLTLLRAFQ